MRIEDINYRAVKVFLALYKYRKANQAAAELGLTNVAISRELKGLRDNINDVLFIRKAAGFIPTTMAEELLNTFQNLGKEYRDIERRLHLFNPKESEGRFEILVYDEFSWAVQSVIKNSLLVKAPKMRFNTRIVTYDCSKDLADGKIDFAVVYEGFEGANLNFDSFSSPDTLYILCRKDHPLKRLSAGFTTKELSQFPLVEIDNYKDVETPLLFDICMQDGFKMKIQTYTESVASACHEIASSNAVCVVCNQFTRKFIEMMPQLECIELPQDIMQRIIEMRSIHRPIGNYLVYSEANRSPAFVWVKEALLEGLKKQWEEICCCCKE